MFHPSFRRTAAVAAGALAVALAAAGVGRLASGPAPPADVPNDLPKDPAAAPHAATVPAPPAPGVPGPAEAADRIRRAKVRDELRAALAKGEPAPDAPGEDPAGEDDPRLAPLRARLAENPEDVDALLSVGYVYVEHHAYTKARGYYLRASQVAPDNVEARTHLGTVAYFLGHLDEALHHYEQALALDPDYAPAYFEMGAALRFGHHDLQGAIEAWEHFLELDPNAEEAGRIRELVAEARRMLAEGTVPEPSTPAPAPAPAPEPFDPATAPWPGRQGPDRSQGGPPADAPGDDSSTWAG